MRTLELLLPILFSTSSWCCLGFAPQATVLHPHDQHGEGHRIVARRDVFPLYYKDCHDDIARELQGLAASEEVPMSRETKVFLHGLWKTAGVDSRTVEEESDVVSNDDWIFRGFEPRMSAAWKRLQYVPILDEDEYLEDDTRTGPTTTDYGPDHVWTYTEFPRSTIGKVYGPEHAWTYFRLQ